MVGFKFIFYKIEIDKYYWKIHSKITMISYIKFKFSMFLDELHLDVFLEIVMVVRFSTIEEKNGFLLSGQGGLPSLHP